MTSFIKNDSKVYVRRLDEDFNLKIYRERLNDKYGRQSPISNVDQSTPLKSKRGSQINIAPSFDSLQGRIRDISSNKQKTQTQEGFFRSSQDSSPTRASGMQSKISTITTVTKVNRQSSMYSTPITDDRKYQVITPMRQARFETEQGDPNPKHVLNLVPLHEIVNLRTRLEQAEIQVSQLTPTYLSEMVKLAQVITTQLKRQK